MEESGQKFDLTGPQLIWQSKAFHFCPPSFRGLSIGFYQMPLLIHLSTRHIVRNGFPLYDIKQRICIAPAVGQQSSLLSGISHLYMIILIKSEVVSVDHELRWLQSILRSSLWWRVCIYTLGEWLFECLVRLIPRLQMAITDGSMQRFERLFYELPMSLAYLTTFH